MSVPTHAPSPTLVKIGTCTPVRTEKAPAQVVELGNGRGVEEGVELLSTSWISCLARQRRAHDHSEETDVHDDEIQRKGRGHQYLAPRAEVHAGIRERASRHKHEKKAQSEEYEEVYVGRDAAQALRKLECHQCCERPWFSSPSPEPGR
jgi:hypothetical protein